MKLKAKYKKDQSVTYLDKTGVIIDISEDIFGNILYHLDCESYPFIIHALERLCELASTTDTNKSSLEIMK